jgi:hypothetical protein
MHAPLVDQFHAGMRLLLGFFKISFLVTAIPGNLFDKVQKKIRQWLSACCMQPFSFDPNHFFSAATHDADGRTGSTP